jgi:hypothetical protein
MEVRQLAYLTGPGKMIHQVTLDHIREALVATGLATDAEINQTYEELDVFARDPETILGGPRVFQVWGRRREA